ncbi:hypothetical protein LINPERHAP1_LOCUS41271 [Linum perenne]
MSAALGRLILSPSTTSDHLLPPPSKATHFPSLNFLNRRRNSHAGIDDRRRNSHAGIDAGFSLSLSSDGRNLIPITRSSSPKVLNRFLRLYFGRQRLSAVAAGYIGSNQLEDFDPDLDGDGGGGGKENNGGTGGGGGEGGGGRFDGGDSRLEGFPIWWWWQWLKQSGSRREELFKCSKLIEMVWRPEKEQTAKERAGGAVNHFLGKVKKHGGDILNSILGAILLPFVLLAIQIAEPRLQRSYVPSSISFFLHFNEVMFITMQLLTGTALLLTTLLLWWIRRWLHGGADDDSDQRLDSDDDNES